MTNFFGENIPTMATFKLETWCYWTRSYGCTWWIFLTALDFFKKQLQTQVYKFLGKIMIRELKNFYSSL